VPARLVVGGTSGGLFFLLRRVVEPALPDVEHTRFHAIGETVLAADASRPIAGELVLERFGFA